MLPYNACLSCRKKESCPILLIGTKNNLPVSEPWKCILDQLDSKNLAILAMQIEIQLGMLTINKSRLETQLNIIIEKMKQKDKKIIH